MVPHCFLRIALVLVYTLVPPMKVHPVLFVVFYTEWSDASREMRPEFAELANALRGQAALRRVDCDQEKQLANQDINAVTVTHALVLCSVFYFQVQCSTM